MRLQIAPQVKSFFLFLAAAYDDDDDDGDHEIQIGI